MDFIKKSAYVFRNRYLGLAIDFISSILIVRYLGSEDYGQYTVLYIIPLFIASLGSFGFGPSIIYHINKLKINVSEYLATFTLLGLILSLFYMSVLFFVIPYINDLFYENKINLNLFYISIFFIPSMIIQKYLRAIIRGMYQIKIFSFLLDFFAPLFRLLLISLFIYLNLGLFGIVFVPVLVQGTITLIFFVYLLKNFDFFSDKKFISKNDFLLITKFALKGYLGTTLQKSNESLIMLIASAFLSFSQIGYLSLAKKLLEFIIGFTDSVTTVLMPKVSKSSIQQIEAYIPKVTSILFGFNLLFIIFYLSFLETFVQIVYGRDFIEVIKYSIPLSIVTIFLPFANILLIAITFTGDPLKKVYARGFGFIINLIIFYPLYYMFGAIGFVISIAIGQFMIFLLSLIFFINKFKAINIRNLFIFKIDDLKYLIKTLRNQLAL